MTSYELYSRSTSATLARRAQENPKNANIRFFLGLKYADEGNLTEAIAAFRSALALDTEFNDAAIHLVRALLQLGYDAEAEEVLLQPRYWGENLATRFLYLAQIAHRDKRFERARGYYFDALDLKTLRGPEVHLGLTGLLEAGVLVNVPDAKYALADERIYVTNGLHQVYARMRIFEDCREQDAFVVLLTSEAEEAKRGEYGLGVTNGAEMLIEFLLGERQYKLAQSRVTWVLMHEANVHGRAPMHICEVKFDTYEQVLPQTPFQKCLAYITGQKPKSRLVVSNLAFADLTHEELEDATRHRFFWEAE